MKGGQNLRDLQDKKKSQADEVWIHQPVCIVCKRQMEGFHGRWGDTGTCNATCEAVQKAKPRFPGHSAEDFERKHNL